MEDQVARWRPETNHQSHKNLKALEFSSEGVNFNLGNDLEKARVFHLRRWMCFEAKLSSSFTSSRSGQFESGSLFTIKPQEKSLFRTKLKGLHRSILVKCFIDCLND